jgi:hypothetical protein
MLCYQPAGEGRVTGHRSVGNPLVFVLRISMSYQCRFQLSIALTLIVKLLPYPQQSRTTARTDKGQMIDVVSRYPLRPDLGPIVTMMSLG